jgi:hypothetical protein
MILLVGSLWQDQDQDRDQMAKGEKDRVGSRANEKSQFELQFKEYGTLGDLIMAKATH